MISVIFPVAHDWCAPRGCTIAPCLPRSQNGRPGRIPAIAQDEPTMRQHPDCPGKPAEILRRRSARIADRTGRVTPGEAD